MENKGQARATALINNYIAKTATEEELLIFHKTITQRLPGLIASGKSGLSIDDSMRMKSLLMKKMEARYISDKFINDIFEDIKKNNKLNAVKTIKEQSGLGLKESKDIADELSQFIKYAQ